MNLCDALSLVCGNRCTREKGHPDPDFHQDKSNRTESWWFGDYSNDPSALESEARCKKR